MWNNGCPFGFFGNSSTMGTWGWIGMILNVLFWVGLVIGLVLLTVWLVRRAGTLTGLKTGSFQPVTSSTALGIAQARYARGELSREEYLKLVEDLR